MESPAPFPISEPDFGYAGDEELEDDLDDEEDEDEDE